MGQTFLTPNFYTSIFKQKKKKFLPKIFFISFSSFARSLKENVLGFLPFENGAFWGDFGVDFTFLTLKHGVPCFHSCNFRNSFSGSVF